MCLAKQIPELVAILEGITDENEAEKMKALREAAEYCPACILSALMQGPRRIIEYDGFDNSSGGSYITRWGDGFDYKKEADAYMNQKREDEISEYRC